MNLIKATSKHFEWSLQKNEAHSGIRTMIEFSLLRAIIKESEKYTWNFNNNRKDHNEIT